MADGTHIEWTEATWNPIVGCSVVSPGCTNCYAMKMTARLEAISVAHESANGGDPGRLWYYRDLTKDTRAGAVWSGRVRAAPFDVRFKPLFWKRPRRVFVNSMSDLFHEGLADEKIDQVFAIMALTPQHTYQLLTKRQERMRAYCSDPRTPRRIYETACDIALGLHLQVALILPGVDPSTAPAGSRIYLDAWPLPNVWLGVSVEDQKRADERIPLLLDTPAAVRWISAEPLLSALRLNGTSDDGQRQWNWLTGETGVMYPDGPDFDTGPRLDWVVVGGESGPGARPMHPDWARSLRDQCAAAGVPFFFKQWGEWAPGECASGAPRRTERAATFYGPEWTSPGWSYESITLRQSEEMHRDDEPDVYRLGKKAAGRLLDGRAHDAMPEVHHA